MKNTSPHRLRLLGGLVLCVILQPLLTHGAVERDAVHQPASGWPRMVQQAREEGSVPVIVTLATDESHRPEGLLSPQRAGQQRLAIQALGDQLERSLSGTGALTRFRARSAPIVALEATPRALEALRQSPLVRHLHPDLEMQPLLAETTAITGAEQLWQENKRGSGQAVVILDTGIDPQHPFFEDPTGASRIVHQACFSTPQRDLRSSLCPSGETTQIGGDAADARTTACLDDQNKQMCDHGSHVAGIAAGVDGVAPDAELIAIQVFHRVDDQEVCGSGAPCVSAWTSDIIAALDHISTDLHPDHQIAAVNMSLGSGFHSDHCDDHPGTTLFDNLLSKGIASVAASGNGSRAFAMSSPACIPSVISVGSTDDDDQISSFSDVALTLDLLAPGRAVRSSMVGGGFDAFNGTSMAAPHVAGALAILKAVHADSHPLDLVEALRATGKSITDDRSDERPGLTRPRIQIDEADTYLGNATAYTIGGFANGLTYGSSLTLKLNTGEDLVVDSNGPFSFSGKLSDGESYQVSIEDGAAAHDCTIADESGTVGISSIWTVEINCTIHPFRDPIHIRHGANGDNDGSSWQHAYPELRGAFHLINHYRTPAEIRIAEGTYRPITNDNRARSFSIGVDGVRLLGGFAGSEADPMQRDTEIHPTILTGNIGVESDHDDNSFHVLRFDTLSSSAGFTNETVIEGIEIRDGYASGSGSDLFGGGLYCIAFLDNHACSPTLKDVQITSNWAVYGGGAAFEAAYGAISDPRVTNTRFELNLAREKGGGLYLSSYSGGTAKGIFREAVFSENAALDRWNFRPQGGGAFIAISGSSAAPEFSHSEFLNNLSESSGGAIYLDSSVAVPLRIENSVFRGNGAVREAGAIRVNGRRFNPSSIEIYESEFRDNQAEDGGAIVLSDNEGTIIADSVLIGNKSERSGGAIKISNDQGTIITDSLLLGNDAKGNGGAIAMDRGTGLESFVHPLTITGTAFVDNDALANGGAIYAQDTSIKMEGSQFSGNSAGEEFDGGGLYWYPLERQIAFDAVLDRVLFLSNSAGRGGGMFVKSRTREKAHITGTNLLFKKNLAYIAGGGLFGRLVNLGKLRIDLINITSSENVAPEGSAIKADGADGPFDMTMTNSIVWGNQTVFADESISIDQADVTVEASIVPRCPTGATCDPNTLHQNPIFSGDQYRLRSTSPAIDAGLNAAVEDIETDFFGNPRIFGESVDIGYYEFLDAIFSDDFDTQSE